MEVKMKKVTNKMSAEKLQGEVSQAGDFTRYLVKMMTEKDETLAAYIAAK